MEYNAQNGEVVLPIGGQPRTLAFTMGALMLFASTFPGGLVAGFDALLDPTRLDAVAGFVYHALNQRKKQNNLPPDFSVEMAADWVAELIFTDDRSVFTALASALQQSVIAVGNRTGLATTTTTETTSPQPATI